jgi:hypothetical protein
MCRIDRVVANLKDNFFRAVRSCKLGAVPLQVVIVSHHYGLPMDSPARTKNLPQYRADEFVSELDLWLKQKSTEMDGATPREAAEWLRSEQTFGERIRIFESFEQCAEWWIQPHLTHLDAFVDYLLHDGCLIYVLEMFEDRP